MIARTIPFVCPERSYMTIYVQLTEIVKLNVTSCNFSPTRFRWANAEIVQRTQSSIKRIVIAVEWTRKLKN